MVAGSWTDSNFGAWSYDKMIWTGKDVELSVKMTKEHREIVSDMNRAKVNSKKTNHNSKIWLKSHTPESRKNHLPTWISLQPKGVLFLLKCGTSSHPGTPCRDCPRLRTIQVRCCPGIFAKMTCCLPMFRCLAWCFTWGYLRKQNDTWCGSRISILTACVEHWILKKGTLEYYIGSIKTLHIFILQSSKPNSW